MANRIVELAKDDFIIQMNNRYTNAIFLSGVILSKPKFFKCDSKESASFILYQINIDSGNVLYKSFNCIAYHQPIVEQLRNFKNVVVVKLKGSLMWSPKLKTYTPQIYQLEEVELLDEPLETREEK